ncbi:glycogen/starch/alpha-glucan phosphorylase [Planococcus dechangensis]|uniref:Alpha-1,4 glucan phosphorylase n=1 Tax=Planococcus dechangensis TaxID=1176255 RepID=A0ABV9MA70_9BACL
MFYSKEQFKEEFNSQLVKENGDKTESTAYKIIGDMLRKQVMHDWEIQQTVHQQSGDKQLYYISIEFLLGRLLGQNLLNLGFYEMAEEALGELGYKLSELEELEQEPGLGNGGLGRLAACFLDSLASTGLPGHGCGIRYRGGLFTQHFIKGFQVELPTDWIKEGQGIEVRREELALEIPFYGEVSMNVEQEGVRTVHENAVWVKAVPYDMPIVGAKGGTINTLRLWQAETSERPLPYGLGYLVHELETAKISDRLYPDDALDSGKLLRLKQQYFLCSASIRTILATRNFEIEELPEKVAIQINDTHPALAVPELMRALLDDYGLDWDQAWDLTTRTISYTNHTILEEAMEKWESRLLSQLLPRVYLIIEEIDRRFKAEWASKNFDEHTAHKLSIIEGGVVKMAVLAVVGSHKVNGVAKLHTEILKKREMKELNEYFPGKFHNKTNGITHRRWLLGANPELSSLITENIGSEWIQEPDHLKELAYLADSRPFLESFQAIKRLKKDQLIHHLEREHNVIVDTASIFDIHIKRIHGYKRQLMNILHVQQLYKRIKNDANYRPYPRTFLFGGKAAPSYHFAKQVIKLINTVATRVNNDPVARRHLHVVFVEDYNVSHAEYMIPAADISEQISTASKEASGTGNMKFMMNGALTLGTYDGANVEIFDAVGEENAFVFGMSSEEVMRFEHDGTYNPMAIIEQDAGIRETLEELARGEWSDGPHNSDFIVRQLTSERDPYFILKDLPDYAAAHERVLDAYSRPVEWAGMCVKNMAASGVFSSDRTIRQYSEDVWGLSKVPAN